MAGGRRTGPRRGVSARHGGPIDRSNESAALRSAVSVHPLGALLALPAFGVAIVAGRRMLVRLRYRLWPCVAAAGAAAPRGAVPSRLRIN
jgi:hypothetical protein